MRDAVIGMIGESQIDELAAKIGKDPYEFRLANAAKPGEEFFPGMRPFDGTLKQDLETAAKAIETKTSATEEKTKVG